MAPPVTVTYPLPYTEGKTVSWLADSVLHRASQDQKPGSEGLLSQNQELWLGALNYPFRMRQLEAGQFWKAVC